MERDDYRFPEVSARDYPAFRKVMEGQPDIADTYADWLLFTNRRRNFEQMHHNVDWCPVAVDPAEFLRFAAERGGPNWATLRRYLDGKATGSHF